MRLAKIRAGARGARKVLGVSLLLVFGAFAAAPAGQQGSPGTLSQRTLAPFDPPMDQDPIAAEHRAKAINAARQKSLVSDTDKLLQLARELNTEIAAANAGSLTPIQQRKLGEIEKLAHSVKDKMSDATVAAPIVRDVLAPIDR